MDNKLMMTMFGLFVFCIFILPLGVFSYNIIKALWDKAFLASFLLGFGLFAYIWLYVNKEDATCFGNVREEGIKAYEEKINERVKNG